MFNNEEIIMTAYGDKLTLYGIEKALKKYMANHFEKNNSIIFDLSTLIKGLDYLSVDIVEINNLEDIDYFAKEHPFVSYEFHFEDCTEQTVYIRKYKAGRLIGSLLVYWKDNKISSGGYKSYLIQDDLLSSSSKVIDEQSQFLL